MGTGASKVRALHDVSRDRRGEAQRGRSGSTFNLTRAEGVLGMSWGGEGGRRDEEGCPGGGQCSRTLIKQVRVAPA